MTTCTVATTSMLIAIACTAFCGCSKIEDNLPPAVTSSVTRDFNQGDALRTAAHYTDDAQILPPRHPLIEGKPAIAAFFEANIDKYIGFGNETTWSVVRGDVGIEQGIYRVRNVRVGQEVETGKYLRVWKRTHDGWRLYRDMFSPDSAMAQAVLVTPEESTTVASGETPVKK